MAGPVNTTDSMERHCDRPTDRHSKRHWAEAWIGRPYIEGTFDCAHLVVEVMATRFGRHITLPAHGATLRGRDAQIAALKATLARPLEPHEAPREGDAVLMRASGRLRVLGHHIGVWCLVGHEPRVRDPHVLHCMAGIGTCLHPIRGLASHGLEMTGIHRWL